MMLASPSRQADLTLLSSILRISQPICTSCARSIRRNQDGARQPSSRRSFSVLNRPAPNYPGHVPLTSVERVGLAVGSAVTSLIDPYRHDMIAACGEATAQPFFISWLRKRMLSDPTG